MAAMAEAASDPPPPTLHESAAMGEEDYSHLQIVPISSSSIQEKNDNQYAHRFQRTDRWLPVYSWLESLATDEVVKSEDVLDWLTANPEIREQLYSRHSRYHLVHYIKKCHMKVLKRKEKKMEVEPQTTITTDQISLENHQNNKGTKAPVSVQEIGKNWRSLPKDSDLYKAKRKEALEKYGLLVEFEKHLLNMVSKRVN